MMDIVCGIDDNFAQHCGILMVSVIEHNMDVDICFHIITEGLTSDNKKKLEDIASSYDKKVLFYIVNRALLSDCSIKETDHLTLATYLRILTPKILPKNIDKVLYLDCDMVVVGSITDLWNIDLCDYAVGACKNQTIDKITHYNRLDYDMSLGYFNAGVLLINLAYWRKNDISDKLLLYIKSNATNLLFHDQDALNYILRESKIDIPMQYNVQEGYLIKDPLIRKDYWEELNHAINNPVIIHYTGPGKPWHIVCDHPWKGEYIKYKNKTVWSKVKPAYKSNNEKIRMFRDKILYMMGLKQRPKNRFIDLNEIFNIL